MQRSPASAALRNPHTEACMAVWMCWAAALHFAVSRGGRSVRLHVLLRDVLAESSLQIQNMGDVCSRELCM